MHTEYPKPCLLYVSWSARNPTCCELQHPLPHPVEHRWVQQQAMRAPRGLTGCCCCHLLLWLLRQLLLRRRLPGVDWEGQTCPSVWLLLGAAHVAADAGRGCEGAGGAGQSKVFMWLAQTSRCIHS